MRPMIIKQRDKYFVAFWDDDYRDYIIEFGMQFTSNNEAQQALSEGTIYPDMPCKYQGK